MPPSVYQWPFATGGLLGGAHIYLGISLGAFSGPENSTNDHSYPRWCTSAFQEPRGSLSLPPCVLGSVCSSPLSTAASALAVSASAVTWSSEVLESIRLSVSCVGRVSASLRSWLSHLTPVRVDHLNAVCSSPMEQHFRTCMCSFVASRTRSVSCLYRCRISPSRSTSEVPMIVVQ